MECILLAGGRPEAGEELWAETRGGQKARIDVAGRPMIAWVLDALLASRHIDRVVVVGLDGPLASHQHNEGVEFDGDHGSLVDNLYAGIARVTPGQTAAFCWSDIPLVTAPMIDRFIEQTPDPTADITAGLVARVQLQSRYPDARDLWLRIREGSVIAADFGLFQPSAAERARRHFEALMPQRKSAARQARYLGLSLLVRYLLGRLTIPKLEAHVRRRFAIECRVRIVDDPELGLDVDNLANLAVCRRALSARRTSAADGREEPPAT